LWIKAFEAVEQLEDIGPFFVLLMMDDESAITRTMARSAVQMEAE
jgi:hypothetical protein